MLGKWSIFLLASKVFSHRTDKKFGKEAYHNSHSQKKFVSLELIDRGVQVSDHYYYTLPEAVARSARSPPAGRHQSSAVASWTWSSSSSGMTRMVQSERGYAAQSSA